MTRTVAREIAIQLSFSAQLAGDDARETADTFFSREYFATLAEEDPLFQEYPDEKQLDYIRRLTGLVYDHMYELNHMIEKYARGWRLERISRVAAAIMRCAMCEILYMDDVPNAAAINEAVELAKGYEEPETVAFINGVLGASCAARSSRKPKRSKQLPRNRLPSPNRCLRTAPKADMAYILYRNGTQRPHQAAAGCGCAARQRLRDGEPSNYKVYPSDIIISRSRTPRAVCGA
ncbi:MAG: transcription antitermination factor NusB [Oscillospiraceae bacterium]